MNGESAAGGANVPSESTDLEGAAYYVQIQGSVTGPLSPRQIREWIDAGRVSTEVLCWTTTDAERFPVSDILDLLPADPLDNSGTEGRSPGVLTNERLSAADWLAAAREGLWLGLTCFLALTSLTIPMRTQGLSLSYEAAYFTIPLYPGPLLASLLSDWLAIALAWVQFPLYVMILGLGGRRWGLLRTLAGLIVLHFAAILSLFALLAVLGWLRSSLGWGS